MNISTCLILIEPKSAFGTPLKGDTLFGQFCWQVAEDPSLASVGIDELLSEYDKSPFVVVSSAWPTFEESGQRFFALPRPEIPLHRLGDPEGVKDCADRLRQRKQNKGRRWFLVSEDLGQTLAWQNLLNDDELLRRMELSAGCEANRVCKKAIQHHNTINRQTMTTGKGMFAPYVMTNIWYSPGMHLAIFAAFDADRISGEQLQEAFVRIGEYGFGRDASTGLGRFEVKGVMDVSWPGLESSQEVFTLGPVIPEKERYEDICFTPFVRYGKHGAQLLHTGKPFKNPVVMADEGAVLRLRPGDELHFPWVGRPGRGVSKTQDRAVVQGYSLVLPVDLS